MGGKTATSTSQTTIPSEVLARYNAVNTMAEGAASKPYQSFGTQASDYIAQMNQQQNTGINSVNAAAGSYQPYLDAATGATQAGMGSSIDNIQKYMSPYLTNVADTTSALMRQSNEQAQSGALGAAASSGAFGGDRAGIAAANLAGQNQLAMGKTMADIYNQGYGQAASLSQADLARQLQGGAQMAGLGAQAQGLGLQGAQAQLAAGTMQQQTEQAGKDAMIKDFMQRQGYPFQTAQFLANIALGTGVASGTTTTAERPVGFFQNLATGGRANGYADGGGVAGPMQYAQSDVGPSGYVPAGVLPVGDLMISQIPQDEQKNGLEDVMKIASIFMGGKAHGGAAVGRHGYQTDGAVRDEPGLVNSLTRMARDSGQFISDMLPSNPRPQEAPIGPNRPVSPGLAGNLARAGSTAGRFMAGSRDATPTAVPGVGGGGADRMPVTSQGLAAAPRYKEYVVGDDVFRRTPQGTIIDGYGNPVDINRAEAVRNAIEAQDMLSGAGRLVQSNEMADQFRQSKEQSKEDLAQRNRDALAGMYQGDFPVSERASGLAAALPPTGGPGTFPAAGMPAATSAALSGLGGPGTFPAAGMPQAGLAPTSSIRPVPRPDGLGAASVATQPAAASPQSVGFTGVAGAGKGYTDVILPDGTVERREGARNWRNNNPGNIEFGPFAEANGAIGSDGRFAVFPTYEAGRSAKEALLFSSDGYAGKTIAGAIERYAPRSDNNNTDAYIATVAGALGVDPNTPLAELNPAQRNAMLTAMERVEGGGSGNDGQFSSYSTTPIALGGDGVSGLAGGAGQTQTQPGGLGGNQKSYEDRNALGKFLYDPSTGKMNKDAIMSILSGLGTMASSTSMSPFTALLQGAGAGAATYSQLEQRAADIAQTEATTRQTDIAADKGRIYEGQNGTMFINLGGGMPPIELWRYLENPAAYPTGDRQLDAQILRQAQAASVNAPSADGVFASPVIQTLLGRETENARRNPNAAIAQSAPIEAAVNASAAVARSSIPSILTQADAVAAIVSPDAAVRAGALGPLKQTVANYLNDLSQTVNQMTGVQLPIITDPNGGDAATNAQIILKEAVASGMLNASGIQELQQIMGAQPNVALSAEANSALMAGLLVSGRTDMRRADFMRNYKAQPGNTYRTVIDADQAFQETYGDQVVAEKAALKEIIHYGNQPMPPEWAAVLGDYKTPMEFLMTPGIPVAAKNEFISKLLPALGMNDLVISALQGPDGMYIGNYFGG
jgi:hypothetical protein